MKIRLIPLLLLLAAQAAAQPARSDVRRAGQHPDIVRRYLQSVASAEPMRSAAWGVLAMTAGGDTIAAYRPFQKLTPASNTKLISTGLAIAQLGPDYTFETSVGYTGTISDGVLHGDLYIVGGGDPTIGSRDSIATWVDAIFAKWYNAMKAAGIRRIDGRIIGDGRFFDGPSEYGSWCWGDLGTYYSTGGDGLCFYRNVKDFQAVAGSEVGAPISLTEGYPDTPWMRYTDHSSTGPKGTGDELYLFTSSLAPVGDMRGTFAVDRKPKRIECSNKYGAMTCALYFSRYLEKYSVTASGGIADVDMYGIIREDLATGREGGAAADPSDIRILGTVTSPSLKRIARITNYRSDNFYAETLFRILGKEKTGSASQDSSIVARERAFAELGLDTSRGESFDDGSGLSRQNWVSPDFMCRFLRAMMDNRHFGDYVETLQQPGKGSYSGRLSGEDEGLKSRIFMKSGSMSGVLCFSGYVVPADGSKEDTIIFSVLVNNYDGPSWKLNGIMDKIIALTASCN